MDLCFVRRNNTPEFIETKEFKGLYSIIGPDDNMFPLFMFGPTRSSRPRFNSCADENPATNKNNMIINAFIIF